VTHNIWGGARWIINVHLWDSAVGPEPFRLLAQYDMSEVLTADGRELPRPWTICAEAAGQRLRFGVWAAAVGEPDWDDPSHVRETTLPPEAVFAGRAGWFIGHLPASGRAIVK
jgi:hypothetical protein